MIRILHVDDDWTESELTQLNILRNTKELEFHWTEGGESALNLLRRDRFDCILSDLQMPGMSGLELLKTLREQGNNIPFIFLTGQGSEEIAANAFREGADDYYSKDVGIAHYAKLVHAIKRLVELKHETQSRLEAEEKHREVESLYSALFQSAGDAIFIIQDGICIDCNAMAQELFQKSECRLIHKSFDTFFDSDGEQDTQTVIEAKLGEALKGDKVTFEMKAILDNGRSFYAQVDLKGFSLGDGPLVMAFVRDVTERRKWEKTLQRSERNYREIFNSTMDAVLIHHPETGQTLDVNDTCLKMYDQSREAALAGEPGNVGTGEATEASRLKALELIRRAAAGDSQTFEWRSQRSNGEQFWTNISLKAVTIDGKLRVMAVVRDIDKIKTEQSTLKWNEDLIKKILLANPEPMTISSAVTGRYALANDSFYEISGYTPEDIIGKTADETGIWVDRNLREQAMAKLQESGQVPNLEASFRLKDGSIYSVTVTAWKATLGGEPHIISLTHVKDRMQQVSRHVRVSNDSFRNVFNTVQDGLFVWLSKGAKPIRCLEVNESACEMLEYTREELYKLRPADLGHPEYIEEYQKTLDVLEKEGKNVFHMVLVSKSGKEVPVEINSVVSAIEGQEIIISAARDLSPRKEKEKVQEELEDSRRRYKQVFDHNIAGVFFTSVDGKLIDANERAQKIFGYPEGLPFSEINVGRFHALPEQRELMIQMLREKGQITNIEFKLKQYGGKEFWALFNAVLLDDKSILGTVLDITELKEAQKRIEHQNRTLMAVNRELEAFNSSLSHDLKAPIRHVIDYAQLMMDNISDDSGQDAIREHCTAIISSGKEMQQMVDEYLGRK